MPSRVEHATRVKALSNPAHEPMVVAGLAPDRQGTLPGDWAVCDHQISVRCNCGRAKPGQKFGCWSQFHLAQMMPQHNTVTGMSLQQQLGRFGGGEPAKIPRGV